MKPAFACAPLHRLHYVPSTPRHRYDQNTDGASAPLHRLHYVPSTPRLRYDQNTDGASAVSSLDCMCNSECMQVFLVKRIPVVSKAIRGFV